VAERNFTPYNAQVSALLDRLPAGSRVGTVDKFQGQEAPVVLYSMATSPPEDAPRGMESFRALFPSIQCCSIRQHLQVVPEATLPQRVLISAGISGCH
jgi:hypothetical protein